MKPLTKTVVSRNGGIAGRFEPATSSPMQHELRSGPKRPSNRPDARSSPVVGEPKPKKAAKKVANPKPVANLVANVANEPRYAKWRAKNPELFLERQRAYQADYRKRRAADKATKA